MVKPEIVSYSATGQTSAITSLCREGVVEGITKEGKLVVRVGENIFHLHSEQHPSPKIGTKILLSISRGTEVLLQLLSDTQEDGNKKPIPIKEQVSLKTIATLLSSIESQVVNEPSLKGVTQEIKEAIENFRGNPSMQSATNKLQSILLSLTAFPSLSSSLKENIYSITKDISALSSGKKGFVPPIVTVSQEIPLPFRPEIGKTIEASVESVRADGKAMISLRGSPSVPISLPITVSAGSLVKFIPLSEREWEIVDYGSIKRETSSFEKADAKIERTVRAIVENAYAGTEREPSDATVSKIIKNIFTVIDKTPLTMDDIESLTKILCKTESKPTLQQRIPAELSLYPQIKQIGESIGRLLAFIDMLPTEKPQSGSATQASSDSIMKLNSFISVAKTLIVPLITEGNELQKIAKLLKKIDDTSGQQYEHKITKLLNFRPDSAVREQLLTSIRGDFKGQLISFYDTLDKIDISPDLKDRLKNEASLLLSQIESIQIRNGVEQEIRHMFVPVVHTDEPQSAHVFFKRRGKRGKIDAENVSVTVRVAPSQLGDVEATASVVNGRLSIAFLVKDRSALKLFESEKLPLKERLSGLGYKLGAITVSTGRSAVIHGVFRQTQENVNGKNQGFDITV